MMNSWSLIAMAGALLGAVSCTPVGGSYAGVPGAENSRAGVASVRGGGTPAGSTGSASAVGLGERATSGELRQLREQRAGMGGEQVINQGLGGRAGSSAVGGALASGESGASGGYETSLPPINIDYRYAMPVPGRKGWVYNPYTNRTVDVRGVESGRLIYDERDPENRLSDGTLKSVANMPNKFRVP